MEEFKELLVEAGVLFSSFGEGNSLNHPQSMVIKKLEYLLKNDENHEQRKAKFMAGLKIILECDEQRNSAFLPCIYTKTNDDGNMGQSINQDSLIKILLNTELQPEIIDMILEYLADTIINEENNVKQFNMLLNSLRYLPFLVDADTLSTKLLEILEIAPLVLQYEILYAIPEILPDKANECAAKELSKLLPTNPNITGAIIDCLNALNLSKSIRREIQEYVVHNVLASRNIDIFPILYEFLITDYNIHCTESILMRIRSVLNNIFNDTAEERNKESIKLIIIGELKKSATIFKEIYNGWLTIINNVSVQQDHKPIDLLLLFVLRSISTYKNQTVDAIIKKHVKLRLFNLNLLQVCLCKYVNETILQDCLTSVIEIAGGLLKSRKDQTLTDFATEIYKRTFFSKASTFVHRQLLLQDLILQIGHHDQENVTSVMNVFVELLEDKPLLKRHHLKLLEMLEHLDALDLKDTRTTFDVLCSIVYDTHDDETMLGIQNELHIFIRKQVSCSKRFLKHRGIVCSVIMAKHIATMPEENGDRSVIDAEAVLDISRIPSRAARDATKLLNFAYAAACNSPTLRGLYYDELSTMLIGATHLDRYFLAWLYETITQQFQDAFVTESTTDNCLVDVDVVTTYCINGSDEMETEINVNIAGLIGERKNSESIVVLAPIFRLLRLLHYIQNDGDLCSIDALLGCGIVMPHIVDGCFDRYGSAQLNFIANCLFHCVNWFREIISAFTCQKLKPIRQKVLKRLNQLIELESQLHTCMEHVPMHKLPDSYFNSLADQQVLNKFGSPPKVEAARPRKRLKVSDANSTIVSSIAPSGYRKRPTVMRYIEFREIDIQTIKLLRYPLGGGTVEETPASTQQNLNLKQFNFLINDFVRKLCNCLKGRSASSTYRYEPKKLITDSSNLLPTIRKHLKIIVNSLNMILDESNATNSAELYTIEANELKNGFKTIIELFSLIYSWSGFHQSENYDLLASCLKSSIDDYSATSELVSLTVLVRLFVKKLTDYERNCLLLQSAVFLVQTIKQLYTIEWNMECQKALEAVTAKMLSRQWYNEMGEIDTGRNAFVNLDVIIKAHFENRTVEFMAEFVDKLEHAVDGLRTKTDCLSVMPSINNANFHVLFRGVCHALLESIKTEIQSLANNQHLVLWKSMTKTLEQLITIVKARESRSNLLSIFNKVHGIMKLFLTKGIPILQITLKSNANEVITILKSIQITTRFLHNLCCHSKTTKDSALIKLVPHCKCTLETIIYRVKAALIANGCTSSFWMGNLKNKDLNGEIILSQTTSNSEIMEDTSELSPDDDDENEDMLFEECDTENQRI